MSPGAATGVRAGAASAAALRAAALLGALALGALALGGGAPPAGAVTVGAAGITVPGGSTALGSGGSATSYGVALPASASCPGDTAHDGYHVYSYLVPEGVDPASVSFRTGLPGRYFGFISDGAYYGAVNTAEDTGQIVGLPSAFTWSRLTPAELFTGGAHSKVWQGGIACADTHGTVTDTWGATVRFTASATDPGGFTWRVLHPAAVSTGRGWQWAGIGLLAVAVAAGSAAVVLARHSGRASGPTGGGTAQGREGGSGSTVDAGADAADREREVERAGR